MSAPRSLAEDLRRRSESDLTELFLARTDLLSTGPADFSALAKQAGNQVSVTRAIAWLDAAHLMALTAVAIAEGPVDPADLRALGQRAQQLVADLWKVALVWGDPHEVRVLNPAREVVLGPSVLPRLAGLVPGVAELAGAPAELRHLVEQAPADVRDRLDAVIQRFPDRPRAAATGPLKWLREHGVLVPVGGGSLVLPTELAMVLAGFEMGPDYVPWTLEPPEVGRAVDDPTVAHSAAAAAGTAVDLMGHLLDWLAQHQPGVLRSGGLSVRDSAKLAAALGCDPTTARVLVEIAAQLGLMGVGNPIDEDRDGQVYLPYDQLEDWKGLDRAARWAAMALAWLRMPRRTHPEEGDAKLPNVLTPELGEGRLGRVRAFALSRLAGLGAVAPQDFLPLVGWHLPLQYSQDQRQALITILAEAQFLGLIARDCLTRPGQALLALPEPQQGRVERSQAIHAPQMSVLGCAGLAESAAAVMRELLPQPVSEIIVQADLTVIVPGPPTSALEAFLRDVADVESRGAATVLRVSPPTLRRALGRGQSAAQLRAGFAQWSSTDLPQPLGYLIDEVERNYGRLRVGSAQSFLCSDDPGTLAAIAADPKLSRFDLLILAPTVAVSSARREDLAAGLSRAGYAAVTQSPDGQLVTARIVRATRAVPVSRGPVPWELPPSRALAEQMAAHLKLAAQEPDVQAPQTPPERIPSLSAAKLKDVLSKAAQAGTPLWVDQIDRYGLGEYQLIWPIQVSGGKVLARTDRNKVARIPVSRIAGATPA